MSIGRLVMAAGAVLFLFGAVMVVFERIGLGELPGNLSFWAGPVKVYIPVVTCIVVSVVATVLLNLFLRR
jgi:hypothetical protein